MKNFDPQTMQVVERTAARISDALDQMTLDLPPEISRQTALELVIEEIAEPWFFQAKVAMRALKELGITIPEPLGQD
jgi:hypothetical protein